MPRKPSFQHRKCKLRLKRLIKSVGGPSDSLADQSNGETLPVSSTIGLGELRTSLSLPSKSWCDQSPESDSIEKLVIVKLCTYGDVVRATHTLTI